MSGMIGFFKGVMYSYQSVFWMLLIYVLVIGLYYWYCVMLFFLFFLVVGFVGIICVFGVGSLIYLLQFFIDGVFELFDCECIIFINFVLMIVKLFFEYLDFECYDFFYFEVLFYGGSLMFELMLCFVDVKLSCGFWQLFVIFEIGLFGMVFELYEYREVLDNEDCCYLLLFCG